MIPSILLVVSTIVLFCTSKMSEQRGNFRRPVASMCCPLPSPTAWKNVNWHWFLPCYWHQGGTNQIRLLSKAAEGTQFEQIHRNMWCYKEYERASLVAQWLGIHLSMQRTRARALVWEDPTCRGETKPVRHNYWACVPQLLKPVHLEPVLRNKRSHRKEKPAHHKEE